MVVRFFSTCTDRKATRHSCSKLLPREVKIEIFPLCLIEELMGFFRVKMDCVLQKAIPFSWNAFLPCLPPSWGGLGTRDMGERPITHTLVQILSLHSGNVMLQIRVVELSVRTTKPVTFCFTLVKRVILFFPYIILSQVVLKACCLCRSPFWAYLYWQAIVEILYFS